MVPFKGAALDFIQNEFKKNYNRLCRYAANILTDTQHAEDVVLEAFMKVIDKEDVLSNENEIEPKLFTAIDNICEDHKLQQQNIHKSIAEMSYVLIQSEAAKIEADIEAEIEAEINWLIRDEISKLPSQRKRVLEQLYMEGLTSRQVADRMKLSRQTVLNHKKIGLDYLRSILSKRLFYRR